MNDQLQLIDMSSPAVISQSDDLFDGSDIEPEMDNVRLTGQILRIWKLMKDGQYRTLPEIERATGDMTSSISAQLRNLKKPQFGSHGLEKRSRGDRQHGYWEYRIVANPQVFIEYGEEA